MGCWDSGVPLEIPAVTKRGGRNGSDQSDGGNNSSLAFGDEEERFLFFRLVPKTFDDEGKKKKGNKRNTKTSMTYKDPKRRKDFFSLQVGGFGLERQDCLTVRLKLLRQLRKLQQEVESHLWAEAR